ncbi:lipopolysaccharide 3-alpha-galactosyltransferase [Pectobacterium parmentieri]|uniref:Lipopolysaccharide 1,3-galactosyltransferase n=1 Tax=Pectobacterium parmentieri TaxID=1905730 RepID=A0A0H3IBW6_PECPM|nr:lipopolysaccharide 3-alpha-galactosyltransferase [Pectobacterium parmentieri]AFI92575.1 Lipopolysaccharide 1,3-galactosyltransferase [Pectobacterium parmentieri]MBI0471638.1 lipopolysaccharide 3-alpha-galactosyltransferase [Pectobacterium parmentieri]MBI0494323.1 lipopolysaccharide 3-alpha-galactosyltransferase [Pectobacterium parmentieri]MBI0555612.1 lipopolysaccharide 3-alpha-galactosyltransferase [Pectobacterium parmentieri]MBI0568652.1 lipopolysaccharide 3-alpha-galactosyltransferase [P
MYFDKEKVIKTVHSFSYSKKCAELDIAFGTDEKFIYGCAIAIASILLKNPDYCLSFHVFTDKLSDGDKARFQEMAEQYNTTINIYIVDCSWLKTLPETKLWSYAIYFRFIIADYFYKTLDKVLYLDADIICNGSLQELIQLDLSNHIAAVVLDGDSNWWKNRAQKFQQPELSNGYFNSGVLLIGVNNWHQATVTENSMRFLTDPEMKKVITHPDQDILNILLAGKFHQLGNKYNTQFSINYELKYSNGESAPSPISNETVFIHYIGPTKPWHKWAANYTCTKYFLKAKDNSPWRNEPLLDALTASNMRYCAKHQFHNGEIIRGTLSFLKYLYKKAF